LKVGLKGYLSKSCIKKEEKMRLTKEQQGILDGKKGRILQSAMIDLIKYGTAMGAKEFIPVTSVHTAFSAISVVALAFPPRDVVLTKEDVDKFSEEMAATRVKVKTTINPGIIDRKKWRQMGAGQSAYKSVMQTVEIGRKCGIMTTFSCIPYLTDNIPLIGDHCAWSESSAILYSNSFLESRTNRDCYETSLYSALLGITPNFGMHLDENRKGTDLVDVQCELEYASDWGALGYFTGDEIGIGIPVFRNLRRPTVEEAVQISGSMSSPGGIAMFHIVGMTPEAPTIAAAFGGNKPRKTYVFDQSAKRAIYQYLNYKPEGKVDLVFLGCPHKTLYEIKEIARMLEGKHVAKDTRLWVMTASSIRDTAEELGYAQIIEDSGAELFADGCLLLYYINAPAKRPKLDRVATDGAKQAHGAKRSFGSNVFFGNTERCIEIAIKGGV